MQCWLAINHIKCWGLSARGLGSFRFSWRSERLSRWRPNSLLFFFIANCWSYHKGCCLLVKVSHVFAKSVWVGGSRSVGVTENRGKILLHRRVKIFFRGFWRFFAFCQLNSMSNFSFIRRFLPQFRDSMSFVLDGKAKTHTIYRRIIGDHKDIHHDGITSAAAMSNLSVNFPPFFFLFIVCRIQGRHRSLFDRDEATRGGSSRHLHWIATITRLGWPLRRRNRHIDDHHQVGPPLYDPVSRSPGTSIAFSESWIRSALH